MRPNLFAPWLLLAMLLLLAVGLPARAACTAGNPNASVIESTPTSDFIINGNDTVAHAKTGLMWKQCAEGLSGVGCSTGTPTAMKWADALNAANAANSTAFAGYTDWRLPNYKELASIVELCGYNPAINQTAFPVTPASLFWSSSSYVPNPTNAWAVAFGASGIYVYYKSYGFPVRLVRGGQSVDAFDLLGAAGVPTCALTASPSTITLGGSAILTATCSPAATSYAWTPAAGLVAGPANTATVTPKAAGVYQYSVTGSNAGGAGNTASTSVTVTCTYSLFPTSQSVAAIATTGTLSVTAASGCAWTTSSSGAWITITSGSSGSGNGTVVYAVAANPNSSSRTGTLTVAGQTFTVTQAGLAVPTCTLSASPSTITAGGSATLTATCNPAATSYAWTNTGFAATASAGNVSPTVTTTYTVAGTNSAGAGAAASATVTVTPGLQVNGSCGVANGVPSAATPSSGLCNSGTASAVTNNNPAQWKWTCAGINGGTTASCSAPRPDTQSPTVPTSLSATAVGPSQINLAWTASTDNVGVTAYKVYRGGVLIATLGNVTSYSDTGLAASTTYNYTVQACDAAGNCSAQSAAATGTTMMAPAFVSQSDCLFNWAEITYASLFAPAGAISNTFAPYYFRYYPQTNAYLATSSADNHVYYLGPSASNSILDVGALSLWLSTAGCLLESVSQLIIAAQGGTLTLPSGSSVTIPGGMLSTDQIATLSLLAEFPQQPPSGLITSVGPIVSLSLTPNQPSASPAKSSPEGPKVVTSSAGLEFEINLSNSTFTGISGSAPVVQTILPQLPAFDGMGIFAGTPGQVDLANSKATLTVSPEMASQFHINSSNSTVTLNGALFNWNPQLPSPSPDRFGGRMWDKALNQWVQFDSTKLDNNAKTCVLVHGMMSSVEKAFPNGKTCATDIGAANGCTQIVGFNYPWWQPILTSGMDLARFLQASDLQDVILEAHSEGGPVTLAALSQPETRGVNVAYLVTLGSPLTGTPAADRSDHIVSLLANYPPGAPGSIEYSRAFGTLEFFLGQSFLPDLTTNNAVLANVRAGATANHSNMQVIPICGTGGSLLDFTDPLVTTIEILRIISNPLTPAWEVALLQQGLDVSKALLNGWIFGSEQQDGIVNGPSCLGENSNLTIKPGTAKTFPLTHTGLECHPSVINYVGSVVNSSLLPAVTISFAANPTTITAGQTSVLSWTTTNATLVSISGVPGPQPASGSVSVSPAVTTTYTLTATGPGGASSATATVTVAEVCTYVYSDWSACQSDNTQTRTVVSSSPAGCVGTPTLSQSCTYTPPPPPPRISGTWAGTYSLTDTSNMSGYQCDNLNLSQVTHSGTVTLQLTQPDDFSISGTGTVTGLKTIENRLVQTFPVTKYMCTVHTVTVSGKVTGGSTYVFSSSPVVFLWVDTPTAFPVLGGVCCSLDFSGILTNGNSTFSTGSFTPGPNPTYTGTATGFIGVTNNHREFGSFVITKQ